MKGLPEVELLLWVEVGEEGPEVVHEHEGVVVGLRDTESDHLQLSIVSRF